MTPADRRRELRAYLARQRRKGELNQPQQAAWDLLNDFDCALQELRRAQRHLPEGGVDAVEVRAFLEAQG